MAGRRSRLAGPPDEINKAGGITVTGNLGEGYLGL
jgi:hypothetical protein